MRISKRGGGGGRRAWRGQGEYRRVVVALTSELFSFFRRGPFFFHSTCNDSGSLPLPLTAVRE